MFHLSDPHIEIAVEHYNSPIGAGDTIVLIATCNVTESDGEPKMAVFCNGSSFDEIISQEFVSEDHADHFSGSLMVVIRTKECLQITCTVLDAHGSYSKIGNITLHNSPLDIQYIAYGKFDGIFKLLFISTPDI